MTVRGGACGPRLRRLAAQEKAPLQKHKKPEGKKPKRKKPEGGKMDPPLHGASFRMTNEGARDDERGGAGRRKGS